MKFPLVAIISILFLSSCGKEDVSLPHAEQLTKDQEAIDKYLLDSGIIAKADPEGLGFKFIVLMENSDFKPALIDSVSVKYSVTIVNGRQVFKDSITTFFLNNLIKPWKTILPLYGEGSKLTLFVPSGLAYGTYPTGDNKSTVGTKKNTYIPANSNLIFDIELKKVIRDYATQFKKDTMEIGSSLKTKSETTLVDPSGIRYKITMVGNATGLAPLATDSVVVRYKGQLFFDGSEFENQLSNPTGLGFILSKSSTPKSWQKILPLIKEDAKVTFYVPSGLGYGPYGNSAKNVPAYANLTYELELVKVIRK
jgi:FKBP-type peptidyl-prolyl cis-trans isomerase